MRDQTHAHTRKFPCKKQTRGSFRPRTFSADSIGQLYRLRWQIELLFKDWKSYANLHAFQTEHPAIVEGFIWASLCAAFLKRSLAHWAQIVADGRAISTRIAAQAGSHILPLLALFATRGFRVTRLQQIFLVTGHPNPSDSRPIDRAPETS
jgi:Transposase DDE domain